MKKLFILLSLALVLVGCSKNDDPSIDATATPEVMIPEENKGYDTTVEVGGFELTFSDAIIWTTIDNEYSEDNGKELLGIPVHVKNVSGETESFNFFFMKTFNPEGQQSDSTPILMIDNALGFDGDIKDSAEKDSYLYIFYEGDGEYSVEFNDFKVNEELIFDIVK